MKKILYIGEFDFSVEQNASTYRIKTICKAIEQEGEIATKITGYKKTNAMFKKVVNYIFRGFYFTRKIKKEKPDIVVYYGEYTRVFLPCLLMCKYKKITFFVDVVEWYNYANLKGGKFGLLALDHRLTMNYFFQKANGIIVISDFLEQHFKKINPNVLRVPVLWDCSAVDKNNVKSIDENDINLVSVLNKNYPIQEIINAIDGYVLHIIGCSWEQLIKKYSIPENVKIKCYGRVPQLEVQKIVSRCDFSIFVRKNNRTSMAGFPTKFVESLAVGTPVIANITTDMDKYLTEGYNGYILNDITQSVINEKLSTIKERFDRKQHSQMRKNAQESAKKNFDYRLYAKQLNEFLQK